MANLNIQPKDHTRIAGMDYIPCPKCRADGIVVRETGMFKDNMLTFRCLAACGEFNVRRSEIDASLIRSVFESEVLCG